VRLVPRVSTGNRLRGPRRSLPLPFFPGPRESRSYRGVRLESGSGKLPSTGLSQVALRHVPCPRRHVRRRGRRRALGGVISDLAALLISPEHPRREAIHIARPPRNCSRCQRRRRPLRELPAPMGRPSGASGGQRMHRITDQNASGFETHPPIRRDRTRWPKADLATKSERSTHGNEMSFIPPWCISPGGFRLRTLVQTRLAPELEEDAATSATFRHVAASCSDKRKSS
jgi:hypothetical protein